MLSFSPLLGINTSRLGMGDKSIAPLRMTLGKESRLSKGHIKTIDPLPLHSPLIQTSKLLSFTPEPNAIGWDNWTPIDANLDSSFDIDSFDSIVNRSTRDISPEFNQTDSLFTTTIFTSELEHSTYIDDSLATIDSRNERLHQQDDLAIPIVSKKGRSKSQAKSTPQSSTKKKPSSAKSKPSKERKISPKTKSPEITDLSPSLKPNNQSLDISISDNLSSPSTLINPSIIPANSSPSTNEIALQTEAISIGDAMDGLISDNSPSTPTSINPSPSPDATPISTEDVRIGATMDGLISDNSSPSPDANIIQTNAVDKLVAENPPRINPPTFVESTPISTEDVRIGATMDGLISDNSPSTPTSINPSPSPDATIQTKAVDKLVAENPTNINPPTFVEATPISIEDVGIGETMDGLISDNSPSTPIINPSPSPDATIQTNAVDKLVADNPISINPSTFVESTPIPTEDVGIGETMDGLISDNSPSTPTSINPSPSVESKAIQTEEMGIGATMDGFIGDNIALNQVVDRNSTNDPIANLPEIEVKGYATGGHVLEPDRVDRKPIAASDIIPAMLTPGEFVINAKDAQKNLNLLTHINSGGELDRFSIGEATPTILPGSDLNESSVDNSIEIDRSTIQSKDLSSKFIQPKSHESLISPSLPASIDTHQISFLNSSQKNSIDRSIDNNTNYSSPPLIFRKAQSNIASEVEQDTPDEWNSIEDLMNGMNNFGGSRSSAYVNSPASQSIQKSQGYANESPLSTNTLPQSSAIYAKTMPATDISTQPESVSTTIEAPNPNDKKNDDAGELEILAREVYHRLRQRLEIERERHGTYSGNLPW